MLVRSRDPRTSKIFKFFLISTNKPNIIGSQARTLGGGECSVYTTLRQMALKPKLQRYSALFLVRQFTVIYTTANVFTFTFAVPYNFVNSLIMQIAYSIEYQNINKRMSNAWNAAGNQRHQLISKLYINYFQSLNKASFD